MRSIITHALALYIGAGLFGGLLIAAAIPALNVIGVSYYAATWPVQVYCARLNRNCEWVTPSPEWARFMFTFKQQDGDHQS